MKTKLLLALLLLPLTVPAVEPSPVVPILKLANGKIFTNAVIRSLNPSEVIISLETGATKAKSSDLPEPWRAKYYDPDKERDQNERNQKEGEARARAAATNSWLARQQFVKQRRPLRVIGRTLYDFTWPMKAQSEMDYETRRALYGWITVSGEISQVVEEGILLKRTDDSLVLLINKRFELAAHDGEYVYEYARDTLNPYQYTSVSGAGRTVATYDCGLIYDPEADEFKTKMVITQSGEEKEFPVTDWDKIPLASWEKRMQPVVEKQERKLPGLRKTEL